MTALATFVQQVINGLMLGGGYALVAIGYTLIFGVLNLLHLATAPAFFGEPNDIAVSVANIRRQPAGRTQPATVREVACDHLTYFNTQAGLNALAELLPPPPTSGLELSDPLRLRFKHS